MRIDRAKLKKSLSDPPADCALLIQKLCIQSNDELRATLTRDLETFWYRFWKGILELILSYEID